MSKKGTKKVTHHTLSLFLPLKTPEAPDAGGAGGTPVPYCEMVVEVGFAVVLSVEPATFALEGPGVGHENGGAVGNSVLEKDDGVADVTVTVERMVDDESDGALDVESTADDDGAIESLVDVEVGEAAEVDEDAVGSATTVVVVVVDILESVFDGEGIRGVGVKITVVVVVV
jgi:hypothetical protein